MQCPVCKTAQLLLSERQGIEIDYCPQCRGVWLDRGELDKLIERSAAGATAIPAAPAAPPQQVVQTPQSAGRGYPDRDDDRDKYREKYRDHHGWGNQHQRKKKSFLGEIFDF